jgi:deoxyribodipyrimidine photo-lyase
VARYAPAHWHSRGTVVDQSYEELDRLARSGHRAHVPRSVESVGALRSAVLAGAAGAAMSAHPVQERQRDAAPLQASLLTPEDTAEPPLLQRPPADLGLAPPSPVDVEQLRGRDVWLVHPWALRPPPADLPKGALVIGMYLREHHQAWPWPEARWRWVDAAMSAVTAQRWYVDAAGLARALAGAPRVRSVDDPHLKPWIPGVAQWDPAPNLFPPVERPCNSFSQWWTRATRGLHQAEDLL